MKQRDQAIWKKYGRLAYHQMSTGVTADWNRDVMLLLTVDSTPEKRIGSNTGIYCRGPKRGMLVTHPAGSRPNCEERSLERFKALSTGWEGAPIV